MEEEKVSIVPHLISDEIKWAIVFHKKTDMSNKKVAKRVTEDFDRPISHQTVKRIWTSYEEKK